MHNTTRLVLSLSLALGLVACDDDADQSNTLVDVAAEAGSFSTLVGALEATGLDATLSGEGPFTVFAPTDEAFARLPAGVLDSLDAETLSQILTYHVVAGATDAATVVTLDSASTVEGGDVGIQVVGGTVVINGATQVTDTDIQADNGVIHVIDSILLPPELAFPGTITQAAQAYPIFDTLVGALVTADLAGTLGTDNDGAGFTVFAPQNQGFDSLELDVSTLTGDELAPVLLYHVVGSKVGSSAVVELDAAETLQGDDIDIVVSDAGVRLNGNANVVRVDLNTSNGIIHVIDNVLIPN